MSYKHGVETFPLGLLQVNIWLLLNIIYWQCSGKTTHRVPCHETHSSLANFIALSFWHARKLTYAAYLHHWLQLLPLSPFIFYPHKNPCRSLYYSYSFSSGFYTKLTLCQESTGITESTIRNNNKRTMGKI